MTYQKSTRVIPLRSADMLVRSSDGSPSPWDQVAAGLYPDETLLVLDDGTEVAVSVERHWLGNGAGIGFHAFARAVEEDGSTTLAPNQKPIEAAVSFNCDPVTLNQFTAQAIADDMALVVLGEPQELKRDVPTDDGTEQIPVINLPEEVLLNGSISAQLDAVHATTSTTLNL